MNRRWPAGLLLAGASTLLVSLYLPWQETPCGGKPLPSFQAGPGTALGLPSVFAGNCDASRVEGWSSVGEVSAIAVILLTFLTITLLARPNLSDRLPLGHVGLLVGYLTAANVAQTRLDARRTTQFDGVNGVHVHFHYAYGTPVGVGAGIATLVGAAWLRREELLVRPPRWALIEVTVAVVLLGAFLLPWWRSGLAPAQRESYLGIESPSGLVAAALAVWIAARCWRNKASRALEPVALGGSVLVFTGATFAVGFERVRAYAAWLGLAVAAALLLVVASKRRQWRIPGLSVLPVVVAFASISIVTSLFLPWQTACYGHSASAEALGLSGRCVSENGFDLIGTAAAALACALVAAVLVQQFQRISIFELTAGLALLVATLGFRLENNTIDGTRFGFGYGSYTCFVATGLLVLLAVGTCRRTFNLRQLGSRAPAIVLCLLYVAAVVTPWWGVLPVRVWTVFSLHGLDVSWLTVAEALLGVRLLVAWLRDARPPGSDEVVLLPLALVALVVLELVPFPHPDLTWSSGLLLGLALALAALGLVDRQGGIRSLAVPEILRFDRI